MKIYNLVKNEDGSVKVETVLTAEEMQFMLEFALMNLIHMGLAPASVVKYAEEHPEEAEKAFLEGVDKNKIGQA
jgi:iron only hydrogenase large subunit-like protein